MSDYGLTPEGPNIKRLDTILDEMHNDLSKKWGFNTRQNPQSLVNHLLTNVADRVAELWEFGEDIYYSQYPSTAEGVSLDNAAQFGGCTRKTGSKSYYPIHCKGTDGTILPLGTMIASNTNPKTYLTIVEEKQITRNSFNKAEIKIVSAVSGGIYTVILNGNAYTYSSDTVLSSAILTGLKNVITDEDFNLTVDENKALLIIEAVAPNTQHTLVLSENMTTETVTSVITFGTTEVGDILIPDNAITEIVKADSGLFSVTNPCGYVAGSKEESDPEFRKSYTDKIFNRSSMMLESIRSAILNNVQGVVSVAPYENTMNIEDDYGRPPHSIEIVVDGGDETQIAQQILAYKAGGISTYGDVVVNIAGVYDEDIPIRFNRPETIYIWIKLDIAFKSNENVPSNYVELLKDSILENIGSLDAGQDVVPQEFMSELYKSCTGISYIDISVASTHESTNVPTKYPNRSIEITARQRAYTTAEMIEVNIVG